MASMYQKLVESLGEEGAKLEMKRRRSFVKNIPGGAFRNKEFAKEQSARAAEARKAKRTGNV